MTNETLRESVDQPMTGVDVDMESRTIKNVKLMNNVSKNGRKYSDKARQGIREHYVGKSVSIEHGNKQWADQVAVITETFVDPNDPKGDRCNLRVKKNAHGETLLDDASDPDLQKISCLSIEVPKGKYKGRVKAGILEVESVSGVNPCALVVDGGTTFTLSESHEPNEEPEETMDIKTLEDLKSQLPELVKQLMDESAEGWKEEKGQLLVDASKAEQESAKRIAVLETELDQVKAQVNSFEKEAKNAERKEHIGCKCEEAGVQLSTAVMEHLIESQASDETVAAIIESHRETLEESDKSKKPPKNPSPYADTKKKSFSARIKEARNG